MLEGYSKQYPALNPTESNFMIGCVSSCLDGDQFRNCSCLGSGCCQLPVPKGTVSLNASISGLQQRWGGSREKPCSYSFLGDKDNLSLPNLDNATFSLESWLSDVPVVLDWRIGTERCREAARNSTSFACRENSVCRDTDADAGDGGYYCSCSAGYEGNPYLPQGCQGINECASPDTNLCIKICTNIPGDFICACPRGFIGDGRKGGSGCISSTVSNLSTLSIGLVFGTGLLALLSVTFLLNRYVKKRIIINRRRKFFKINSGLLLRQETAENEGILKKIHIFTAKELEKATDRFNESRILGRGGQGTVYKGMMANKQIVAIKKSQIVDENISKLILEQFINEVAILSQICHRNVVKLLGCCLETRILLLVYEFAPNGTLFQLIHDNITEFPVTWNMRLKIAADVAGALAYLHSATSLPIFHRDIKSSNLILDEKFVVKVSDFGTSKSLVEVDQTHLTTKVNGTFGYIDPEYFRSSQFTEKSDVYSFGVVLVELLTGLKPIMQSNNTEDDKSLVLHFLSAMKENNLELLLDSQVSGQGEKDEVLAVANLAKRCLYLNGKKRPTMKEVATELECVRISQTDRTKLSEESVFQGAGSNICATENEHYSQPITSDFWTTSSFSALELPFTFDTT